MTRQDHWNSDPPFMSGTNQYPNKIYHGSDMNMLASS